MSGENDPARDHEDEQGTWKDLFGSVFDLADEVTSRISPEEIEEKLRRTLRRAAGGADAAPPEPADTANAVSQAPFVAAPGPATPEPAAGESGATMHFSLGSRSFTVTLDRAVERSPASLRRSPKRWVASRPASRRLRWGMGGPGGLTGLSPRVNPASFWATLHPAERQMFWRLAGEKTYPAGRALMREGDRSDHVVVILDGRTMVSVRDGAAERVVAYRGPGDLIGERAAMQVSVRSATVVAVETVHALVMRTQDFAAFISAHPAVLPFIEKMINERFNEEPVGPEYGPGSAHRPPGNHSAERPGPGPGTPADRKTTVVATNVLGFDRLLRSAGDRRVMHAAMVDMTRSALTGMGEECLFEDRGDGMLVVVPPGVPTPAIMGRLTGALPAALRWHNRIYNICAQIQMRIAVDTAPVGRPDPVMAGQLLATPALAQAISRSRANLGMIVSSSVYDTAIRPYGGPVEYQPVRVEGPGSPQQAWMQMIDPAPDRLARTA
jgi:hypothetical protein